MCVVVKSKVDSPVGVFRRSSSSVSTISAPVLHQLFRALPASLNGRAPSFKAGISIWELGSVLVALFTGASVLNHVALNRKIILLRLRPRSTGRCDV